VSDTGPIGLLFHKLWDVTILDQNGFNLFISLFTLCVTKICFLPSVVD